MPHFLEKPKYMCSISIDKGQDLDVGFVYQLLNEWVSEQEGRFFLEIHDPNHLKAFHAYFPARDFSTAERDAAFALFQELSALIPGAIFSNFWIVKL